MATKKDKKMPEGPACPKCGELKGWIGPRYQEGKRVAVLQPARQSNLWIEKTVETTESLVYTCNACSYTRHEACKTGV